MASSLLSVVSVIDLIESKLSPDWSAAKFSRFIDKKYLADLVDSQKLGLLDHLVKVRLLLSFLLASKKQIDGCRNELEQIVRQCSEDSNEWVVLFAKVVGPLSGQLQLPPPEQRFRDIYKDLDALAHELRGSQAPQLYPGEEHLYISGRGPLPKHDRKHFRVREGSGYANSELTAEVAKAAESFATAGQMARLAVHSNSMASISAQAAATMAEGTAAGLNPPQAAGNANARIEPARSQQTTDFAPDAKRRRTE